MGLSCLIRKTCAMFAAETGRRRCNPRRRSSSSAHFLKDAMLGSGMIILILILSLPYVCAGFREPCLPPCFPPGTLEPCRALCLPPCLPLVSQLVSHSVSHLVSHSVSHFVSGVCVFYCESTSPTLPLTLSPSLSLT